MDVLDRITSGKWIPAWKTHADAYGERVIPAYPIGELIVYEPREDDRLAALVVEDDGSTHLRIKPFSVERKDFLPAVWLPRAKVLGVAR